MDFSRAQTAAIQYGPSPPGTEYFFNLKQLASTAFGLDHVVRYSLPEKPKQEQREADSYGTPLPPNQEAIGLLGLPVFQTVDFLAPAGWKRLSLLDPIVEVSRDKLIAMTEVVGRNGTVKEFISHSDYQVSIKGILAPPVNDGRYSRRYPEKEVKALQEVCEEIISIPVAGRLFSIFGIRNLVIKSVSWPALPGFTNLQAYDLRCVSDEPIELLGLSEAKKLREEAQRLGFAFTPTAY